MSRPTSQRLQEIVQEMHGKNVGLVGDLVADENVFGLSSRISREAPVMILEYAGRDLFLGGAANAIHNLHTLGGVPLPVGLVGEDAAGAELIATLNRLGISSSLIRRETGRETPVKTRIFGGANHAQRQQIVRIDRGQRRDPGPELAAELVDAVKEVAETADVLAVSDYGYGTINEAVVRAVREVATQATIPVVVDSRWRLKDFGYVTAVTPNEPELEELCGEPLPDQVAVETAARRLQEELRCSAVLVTRGAKGMAVIEDAKPTSWIECWGSDEVSDVTGAGDTVLAAFCLALAAGATPVEAAELANRAGGIVVLKRGTAFVTHTELLEAAGAAR